MGHQIDLSLSYVSFQPVLHDWYKKGHGICYPHSKISSRQENMKLETCSVSLPPPPHLGGDVGDLWTADRVPLIYGDKRRKRTRGKKPSAPGAAKGEPKPAAKLPAAVPSFVPPPAQPGASREVQGGPKLVAKPLVAGPSGNRSPPSSPTRTTRTGPRQVFPTHASTPRSSTSGSTLLPTAPVEPPVTMEVPVEQVAQKRKASSPLPSQTATRPVSPPSPRRWETARSRIRGRFRDYISPPVDNIADLPREPATHLWQVLPDEMGKVNIGLAGKSKLVITTSQGELFRQVANDKVVDNTTGHALLKSLLGDGYRILLPCIVKLRDKYTWLQICDSSQWVPPYL